MVFLFLLGSCKSWRPAVFDTRTPRERYAHSLTDIPAGTTAAGLRWTVDADSALRQPMAIYLPYQEKGRLPREVNAAAFLIFELKQGQELHVKLTLTAGVPPFIELYRVPDEGVAERLESPAPGTGIEFQVGTSGTFGLLIQNRIDTETAYTLTIAARGSLAYPAPDPARNRIGSVWGDARDGGGRRHEGVDIFAKKGSPALAAAPGRITRLTNSGIGGKTVWLRPEGRALSLYYAHLDSQWVQAGDYVQTGDTLGQIGNTGNARFTAAHLHFGIYTQSGAVDPAPFIRITDTSTKAPVAPERVLGTTVSVLKSVPAYRSPNKDAVQAMRLPAEAEVRVVATAGSQMRVRIRDTISAWIPYVRGQVRHRDP